jgi:hypothetical protein
VKQPRLFLKMTRMCYLGIKRFTRSVSTAAFALDVDEDVLPWYTEVDEIVLANGITVSGYDRVGSLW